MTGPVDHKLRDVCIRFVEFVDSSAQDFVEAYPDETTWEIPLESIVAFDESLAVTEEGDEVEFEEDWRTQPDAVERHVVRAVAMEYDVPDEFTHEDDGASIRVTGYHEGELYDVGQYSPKEVVTRVIHVRGQVTKTTEPKLRDSVVAFRCVRCETLTRVPQSGDKLAEPNECTGCDRSGPFTIDDAATEMDDYQVVRLQTLPEETTGTETEELDIEFKNDLLGGLTPSDRAVVTIEVAARREKNSRIREVYGKARSVTKLTTDHTDIDTEPYEDDIEEIIEDGDPYDAVIESVAPFHEGAETIKEGLAYLLFGGIEKELPDGSWFRGNTHILVMGDPGTGKTAIARYVKDLVPRSEYATGKSSSDAGLTASAVQDDFGGEGWTLKAGTLVRAHKGVAVIDELDKMQPEDRQGMMDAMSEQKITIQKAASGVMPAACSVLGVANPKFGNFNKNVDIAEQIDLDPTLLSRFDLIFLMTDEPDEEVDEAVASAMTENARVGQKLAADEDLGDDEADVIDPPIPPEMFRAYISLARRTYPVFTEEAFDRVVEEYVELRQINEDSDAPIPSTTRQVETIHRLSEASARIRLDDEVTEDDVQRAIEKLYDSLESLGVDPDSGEIDAMRFETGTTSTSHDRRRNLVAIVEGNSTSEEPATRAEIEEEAMLLMDEAKFEREFEKLQRKGEIYEPETGKYRVAKE